MPTYKSAYTVCGYSENCETEPVDGTDFASSRANARHRGWQAPGDDEPEEFSDRCPEHIGMESLRDYGFASTAWLPTLQLVDRRTGVVVAST